MVYIFLFIVDCNNKMMILSLKELLDYYYFRGKIVFSFNSFVI